MNNTQVVSSLNEAARKKTLLLVALIGVAMILLAVFLMLTQPVFAESFIGQSGSDLLSDIKWWVALGGIAFAILQIVKGRLAIGIVGIVVTALVFTFCAAPQYFGTFGQNIVSIFM